MRIKWILPFLCQERLCQEPRLRRNVYTLSLRPRRAVPSMLRQESRVKLRRDSNISSICKVQVFSPQYKVMLMILMIYRAIPTWTMTRPARPPERVSAGEWARRGTRSSSWPLRSVWPAAALRSPKYWFTPSPGRKLWSPPCLGRTMASTMSERTESPVSRHSQSVSTNCYRANNNLILEIKTGGETEKLCVLYFLGIFLILTSNWNKFKHAKTYIIHGVLVQPMQHFL